MRLDFEKLAGICEAVVCVKRIQPGRALQRCEGIVEPAESPGPGFHGYTAFGEWFASTESLHENLLWWLGCSRGHLQQRPINIEREGKYARFGEA
jgi:hypothetical protein